MSVDYKKYGITKTDYQHMEQGCCFDCMLEVWNLTEYRKQLMDNWKSKNLSPVVLGMNRFRSLALILTETDSQIAPVLDVGSYVLWIASGEELSEENLRRHVKESVVFERALRWNQKVDEQMERILKAKEVTYENPGYKD